MSCGCENKAGSSRPNGKEITILNGTSSRIRKNGAERNENEFQSVVFFVGVCAIAFFTLRAVDS